MSDMLVVRTLLIEDNLADARLTRELMAEASAALFEVDHAGTLAEGIAKLAASAFDVVFLDLSLPDATGLTGVSRLRLAQPSVPLVILTGLDDAEIGIRALEEGAQDYLVKGLDTGSQMQRAARHAIQRKKIEQLLIDSVERAEYANRAMSEFLAAMSHELRTPLNAIIGFSEMIKQEAFGAITNGRYREYAGDIHKSGIHLLNIINDILDLSKIEAGRAELFEEWFPVCETIDAASRMVIERAQRAEVVLSAALDNEDILLQADRRRVMQVLVNLLSNAIKFTPAGGSVTVSARRDRDGAFGLIVADTGIGMAADQIPVALAPFRQVDGSLGRRFDGTGLGLPLSKKLVELHQGNLTVESLLGRGTTVTAWFPPHRVRAAQPIAGVA